MHIPMDKCTKCQRNKSSMVRKIAWSVWFPSGLMIIILFLCVIIMLLVTCAFHRTPECGSYMGFVVGSTSQFSEPAESESEFRSLIRPRIHSPDDSERPSVDEDVEKKIREIYARKGYSNPDPTSEEYPDSYPSDVETVVRSSTARNYRRRTMQKIGNDFDPNKSHVIKHTNGTITYVFPSNVSTTNAPMTQDSSLGYRVDPIVFPDELPPAIPIEECGPDTPVCVKIANYPMQRIDRIISQDAKRYSEVFGNDVVVSSGDKLVQRFDVSDDEAICKSVEKLIHPQGGLTMNNKTVMVVNTNTYMQGIRVELCSTPGQACDNLEHLTFYRTECKQLYHYRTVLAVRENGEPYKDSIRLPSCCKCMLKPLRKP